MTFKPNTLVYLANSYSSKNPDKDRGKLESAQRRCLESYIGGALKKKYGFTFILPIAMSASMADFCEFGTGFSEWEGDDYTLISKCDELWVLLSDGWKESVGVQAEIKFAHVQKIPVKYIDKDTLEVCSGMCEKDHSKISEDLNDYKI